MAVNQMAEVTKEPWRSKAADMLGSRWCSPPPSSPAVLGGGAEDGGCDSLWPGGLLLAGGGRSLAAAQRSAEEEAGWRMAVRAAEEIWEPSGT